MFLTFRSGIAACLRNARLCARALPPRFAVLLFRCGLPLEWRSACSLCPLVLVDISRSPIFYPATPKCCVPCLLPCPAPVVTFISSTPTAPSASPPPQPIPDDHLGATTSYHQSTPTSNAIIGPSISFPIGPLPSFPTSLSRSQSSYRSFFTACPTYLH